MSSQSQTDFDSVVIGSGPGGYHAAIRLGQLGKRVAMIEKDKVGGVCLNVGCIPSKALINASKIVKTAHEASKMGIETHIKIDISKLQNWKQGVVNRLTSGVEFLCKQNHVEIIRGNARFLSSDELEIDNVQRGTKSKLSFKNAVVATGSSSIELPNVKFDGKRILSSTEALELKEVPKSILLIGGGVIGLEIGMAYANLFGTELTIVEILDQLLPGTDLELVNLVSRTLEKLGAKVNTKSKVLSAINSGDKVEVKFETPDGKNQTLLVDFVLVGVGRRPNTKELGIENTGVQLTDKGFIKVDKHMRTNVPNIYAIGDCVGGPLLAHKAMKEGIVAAEVISGENSSADFQAMPAAIFTDPEIAIVGINPEEAKSRGIELLIGKFPFSASGRALAGNDSEGFTKVLADKDSGLVLGVEIVGHEASDLISEASLAIEMGATLEDIGLTVHPHPTLPETLMEASENALGKDIHIVNKQIETKTQKAEA
ncbi:MAG: dihydrolipoyl dehydrogenase [archaeon]|nr:dihydrolipoyl dehydrogenase [archaeon]